MPRSQPIQNYKDSVLISSTPFTVQDDEIRRDAALTRLVTGRAALRALRVQSQAFSDGVSVLTLAQLTTAARQLAGAVATLTQTLMDIELIAAHQQDDGQV